MVKETNLEIPKTRQGFVCLGWSPKLHLTSYGACGKAPLVPRILGIWFLGTSRKPTCETTSVNFVPGIYRELLLSAIWNHMNMGIFPGTFHILPGTMNSKNCSA